MEEDSTGKGGGKVIDHQATPCGSVATPASRKTFDKKTWQREYMRTYRKARKTFRRERRKTVRKTNPPPAEVLRSLTHKPTVVPKAITNTPILTSTHCFQIWAEIQHAPTFAVMVEKNDGVVVREKGGGKRIKYGLVELDSADIHFYFKKGIASKAALFLKKGNDIINTDPVRIAALMDVLSRTCEKRGVVLDPQFDWKIENSHQVMEEENLNDFFKPLAKANWGDEELRVIEDESHKGQPEFIGRRSLTAAQHIRHMLLEFPTDLPERISNVETIAVKQAEQNTALESRMQALQQGQVGIQQTLTPILTMLVQDRDMLLKTVSKQNEALNAVLEELRKK